MIRTPPRKSAQAAWLEASRRFRRRVALNELGRKAEQQRLRELADIARCASADMSPFADSHRGLNGENEL